MKGKKVIALVLTGMIAAGILSGCGQTKGGSESTPASVDSQSGKDTAAEETGAKSDVTLTVAAAQDWIKDWDRKVAEEFTAETGIKIEFQLNPNDQYIWIPTPDRKDHTHTYPASIPKALFLY